MRKSIVPVLLYLIFAQAVTAQTSIPVKFSPGTSGATLSATITGDAYVDYVLGANTGQTMTVKLSVDGTNSNGIVYFNILPPGSDGVAIYNSSINGNDTSVALPESGDYTIRVYQMGNDRDAGKTSGFLVDVSIQ